jgi:hypothetical protein
MSQYFDNKDLFLSPNTKQYGSHMVMTNVHKETKRKYVNIDTRFRDDYSDSQLANYTITLPERITDAKSIYITNVEIPNVLYNVSAVQKNSSLVLSKTVNNITTKYVVTVPDGRYKTITELHSALNAQLQTIQALQITQVDNTTTPPTTTTITDISINLTSSNKSKITSATNTYAINFAVDASGNVDKSLLKSKLGWILGFRKINYTVNNTTTIIAEALPDVFGSKYLYLAIDEFSNGNQRSFISPLPNSFINKNIAARVSIDSIAFGFNNLITANRANGAMVSDKREYTGKIDLQKLNVQLLDEYGNPVSLNGLDFSFCMEVEHE